MVDSLRLQELSQLPKDDAHHSPTLAMLKNQDGQPLTGRMFSDLLQYPPFLIIGSTGWADGSR